MSASAGRDSARFGWRHGLGLWGWLLFLACGFGEVLAADGPLIRIADIKALGNGGAYDGRPVRLEGVVTMFKPYFMVVQDLSGAIYMSPEGLGMDLKVGQWIRVEGKTSPGGFAPIVVEPKVTVLGDGQLPQPRIINWDHLLTGSEDNYWVEVRGIVKRVAVEPGILTLDLDGMEGRFDVVCSVSTNQSPSDSLLDAEVRVRGVYQVAYSTSGQLTGFRLHSPGLEHVYIERAAPADPFAGPLRPIASLLRFNPAGGSGHRVRVQGEVVFHQPGQAVYLRDATASLRARTSMSEVLEPGDQIALVGFPNPGDSLPVLDSATFRRIGPGRASPPTRTDVNQLMSGEFQFELVQIEATLMNVVFGSGRQTLTLQAGPKVFEADHEGPAESLVKLRVGSLLRVTGVCLVKFAGAWNPEAFSLLLRSPKEVEVLKAASWWTLQRLLVLVGALVGVASLGLVWVVSLRARVYVQTVELRRQLEREVELERRYRVLAESSPVGIWQTNEEGQSIFANPTLCRLLGLQDAGDLNRPEWLKLMALCGSDPGNPPVNPGDAVQPTAFETEVSIPGGMSRQVMITSAPSLRSDGSIHGAIHTCVDVSEQKRFAIEMAAARDAALAANRAKSEFLATMSHEIRTPMNGILGMTELLQQTRLEPHQQELTETVASSGRALLGIINDILDFSKIEAGRMTLVTGDLELRPLMKGVVTLLTQSGHGKPVVLSVDCDAAVPGRIRGDAGRLRQILLNLVGNGLKFTRAGSVVVRVRTQNMEAGSARLRFEVVDTGIGIPPDQCALLFQPFQQVDSSDSRPHGGTGLGLAISRRLVEIMGGLMGVMSEHGKGSTFWFEVDLPIAAPPVSSLRVLVARDHDLNRRLSLLALEKLGCEADAVATGREALERLRTASHAVVLFDMRLGDMDGLALAAAIRELERSSDRKGNRPLRLIGVVDDEAAEVVGHLRAGGIDAALGNPPPLAHLREAVFGGGA
jgi:signal transduction histidine kinase/CheY-like chemotaxis protein